MELLFAIGIITVVLAAIAYAPYTGGLSLVLI
jgi:hypothetical protein